MDSVRAAASVVAVAALLLTLWVTLNGYAPGDTPSAARMTSTRDTSLISAALGLSSLLPVKRLRLLLLAGSIAFLILAVLFWIGVLGGR